MKRIRLRDGEAHKARDVFLIALGQAGGQGITIAEMGTRLGIIRKLKEREGKKDITLPNEEHLLLKNIFNNFPFAQVHQDLMDFAEDLKEAADVNIESVPTEKAKKA